MIVISHRGNAMGPSNLENQPNQILAMLAMGYGVEIDVWKDYEEYSGWWLGHDSPMWPVTPQFLYYQKGLWIHCKNDAAFNGFAMAPEVNAFQHTNEPFAVTKSGYRWTTDINLTGINVIRMIPTEDVVENTYNKIQHAYMEASKSLIAGFCCDYLNIVFNKKVAV